MVRLHEEYPFNSSLSFKPLVKFCENVAKSGNGDGPYLPEGLMDDISSSPEILTPMDTLRPAEMYPKLLSKLLSVVFPAVSWNSEAVAAVAPITLTPVLTSPGFKKLINSENELIKMSPTQGKEEYIRARAERAYHYILSKCYGIHEGVDRRITHVAIDKDTGLEKYFYIRPDFRFVDVINLNGPKTLSERAKTEILDKLNDPKALREILPPEHYEFHGLALLKVIDVTSSEIMKELERDLVNSDSMFTNEGFMNLQRRLRILFQKPEIVASISAVQGDKAMLLQKGCDLRHNCIFTGSVHIPIDEFAGSIYERAVSQQGVLRVRDVAEEPVKTRVENEILEMGFRSKLIGPLRYQDQLIGSLDLASPVPGGLGPTDQLLLDQLRPMFAVSLKRALDQLNTNVQTIIKEKCTAVHPSVEWKFQRAVFNHLENRRIGNESELEQIVFRDVFPLYAATDIRGSSELRNKAISDDLTEHLRLSLDIVNQASSIKNMDILGEISHKIASILDSLNGNLSAGDDKKASRFLTKELEPLFPVFSEFGDEVSEAIERYKSAVDKNFGTVYKKRRAFDEAVRVFNDRLSQYLDKEEAIAQSIFPHYFDKHKTDGLDHIIYVGESMVEDRLFSELYVKNLRLWQLMTSCGLAWISNQLQEQLSVPLKATHLILVSHNPISIRFRFDEKRFDVDGAYDTSQEIIRSRIDKAVVKGGSERLTQPDKIAIVYSTPSEAQETLGHIDFLINEGYIEPDIEELELGDLPSVQGLKALRVKVNLESNSLAQRIKRISS